MVAEEKDLEEVEGKGLVVEGKGLEEVVTEVNMVLIRNLYNQNQNDKRLHL